MSPREIERLERKEKCTLLEFSDACTRWLRGRGISTPIGRSFLVGEERISPKKMPNEIIDENLGFKSSRVREMA